MIRDATGGVPYRRFDNRCRGVIYQVRQRLRNGAVIFNKHDEMNMVGHDDEGIQQNIGIIQWHFMPYGFNHLACIVQYHGIVYNIAK